MQFCQYSECYNFLTFPNAYKIRQQLIYNHFLWIIATFSFKYHDLIEKIFFSQKQLLMQDIISHKYNIFIQSNINPMNKKFLCLFITMCYLTACQQKRILQGWDDPNCSQWSDDGLVCKKCAERAYYDTDQKKCVKVDDYCATWNDSTGKCLTCYDGYGDAERNGKAINGTCPIWDGTTPKPPIDYDVNCKCFSNEKVCLECYEGYYFDSEGLCIAAPTGCRKFENNSCTQCFSEYYLNAEGVCTLLPDNCTQVDAQGQCITCQEGYQLLDNGTCFLLPANCLEINQNGGCIDCAEGYFLDQEGDCNFLPDNCNATDSEGTCVECEVGYWLDEQNECEILPQNCFFTDNNGICTECFDGYYIDANKECQVLPENCLAANENGVCTECKNNFELFNGECREQPLVSQPNPNCAEKNINETECTKCRPFYELTDGDCVPTGQNPFCETGACECGTGKCLQCKKGYFLDNNNICTAIGQNCKEYSTLNGKCTSCEEGYDLSEGSCLKQDQPRVVNLNCKTQIQNGTCLTCRRYYTLESGDCIPTDKNPKCHLYNKEKVCECCYYHDLYYLDNNNVCSRKNRNCDQFNIQNGDCTSCEKGYELSKGQCVSLE